MSKSKFIKVLTFRGDKIFIPTVLLFWYFCISLIILYTPLSYLFFPIILEKFLAPVYLYDFLFAITPLGKFFETIGLTQTTGGFFSFDAPNLLGHVIIFSIFLLIFYLVNYILGKLLTNIFKIKKKI